MEKLIITAALTGNITLPTQTPYLPLTPQQIIDEAVRAADAGAASVHIHGRDPNTARPTTEPTVYREIAFFFMNGYPCFISEAASKVLTPISFSV